MKKMAYLALAFLAVFSTFIPAASADPGTLKVSDLKGTPMIVRDGQEIAASAGMEVLEKDLIKTPTPVCQLDVALNNQAGCRLLANSEIMIADAKTASTHLELKNGNLILNIDKLPKESTFRVETPTAVAVVRGTQFWGRVAEGAGQNPVTTFAVREGAVEILAKSVNQTFTINPGEALDIPADGSTLPVIRPALAEELAALEQASAIKTSA